MTTKPDLTTGSANSLVVVTDDRKGRHLALRIHSDGSGSVAIYNTSRARLLSEMSLETDDFAAVASAIISQLSLARLDALRKTMDRVALSRAGTP